MSTSPKYQFYWALRARGLPTLANPTDDNIEEWLNTTDFSQINILCLSNQGLTWVPHQIARFVNLEWLSLADNHIESLPDLFFTLPSLKHLDLSGNNITPDPSKIQQLPKLQYLF